MGQPLYCSTASAGLLWERGEAPTMVMAPPPCVTQQYRLASMAAWLSSKGISQHDLLPHIPSVHLSTVNSSPLPSIAPQSLNSSSQPLCHLGYVWLQQGLILIPFRLPQISCFTHSLKCFSSNSDNYPVVGIRPLLQFPHLPRTGPVLVTLLFFPLLPSYCQVLLASIYSFPLIRNLCPLSAGVLHAFLYLKVYS